VWVANPTEQLRTINETYGTNMRRYPGDIDDPDIDEDLDDFSSLDDDSDLGDFDLLEDPELSLDEDEVEISMEMDADGNPIYYAEDSKVPDSHSQGYSAEEVIEGLEERRRQYREMLRRKKNGEFDSETEEELPDPDQPGSSDGVNISMELDEDGNEIWYANDPRVPGSTSRGLSAEEAVDGLEDRRQEYREMLKKSRSRSKRKQSKE